MNRVQQGGTQAFQRHHHEGEHPSGDTRNAMFGRNFNAKQISDLAFHLSFFFFFFFFLFFFFLSFFLFLPFNCCLSVVLYLDKGDYPENLQTVLFS